MTAYKITQMDCPKIFGQRLVEGSTSLQLKFYEKLKFLNRQLLAFLCIAQSCFFESYFMFCANPRIQVKDLRSTDLCLQTKQWQILVKVLLPFYDIQRK